MDKDDNNESLGKALFRQVQERYIKPEIQRREQREGLDIPQVLNKIQIIISPDSSSPEVRINDEAKIIAKVKVNRSVEKGEPVRLQDITNITEVQGPPKDDRPNCGHITMWKVKNLWLIGFDFRYNKKLAREHLDTAQQFFAVAKKARDLKLWAPLIENLFACAELAAKSTLMTIFTELKEARSHRATHSRYNRWYSMGNVEEEEYKDTFNKLYQLRGEARYLDSGNQFSICNDLADEYIDHVDGILQESKNWLS